MLLFGRSGCHLCVEGRVVVAAVCAETGDRWLEVDVDGPDPTGAGRDLAEEYGDLVPVVEVDGVRQGFWRIDPARLRRALAASAGPPLR
ncbi:thioredoxin family protein [Cellulomonas soli]|uniref:Thioredoxin family protein n=1 Tax=Cellulomonas soli TaxID=931535 RepID=A0A512PG56_9CELL|nr:thioredoxin family protein [Cellulomonas soli]